MSIEDPKDEPIDDTGDRDMELSTENLVRAYRSLRDAKSECRKELEGRMADFDAKLDKLERKLLSIMETEEATSIGTKAGTAFRQVQEQFWCRDWHAFDKFILEQRLPGLLQHRISSKNLKEWMEANPDTPVPGLHVERKYVVRVRKPGDAE